MSERRSSFEKQRAVSHIAERVREEVVCLVEEVLEGKWTREVVDKIAGERAEGLYQELIGIGGECSLLNLRQCVREICDVLEACDNQGWKLDDTTWMEETAPWAVPAIGAFYGLQSWMEHDVVRALEAADEFDEDNFIENVKDHDMGPPTDEGIRWAKARVNYQGDYSLVCRLVDHELTIPPWENSEEEGNDVST